MIDPIIIQNNQIISKKIICGGDKYIYVLLEATQHVQFNEDTMSNKSDSSIIPVTEELKDHNQKHNLSKMELDLYHEEDDIAEKVIRVKRVSMPNKGEKWKIFEDNKVMFIVEGTKLGNKEKDFLRSPDGFNFLIAQYKRGIKSFNALKNEIKKKLK